jgi:hypothetical protein
MRTTKSAQAGSAGGILVLAIIAILIWWQWDRIAAMFGVGGGGTVAEVSNFQCTSQAGSSTFEGTLRNISDAPIEVKIVAAVNDTSGRILEAVEAGIRPTPLPPQQSGGFRASGPAIPDGGSCKFTGVIDAQSGYPVKWRRR